MEAALGKTIIFLCAAATQSARAGAFPAPDEPLDADGRRAAAALSIGDRMAAHVHASPSRSAMETAAALGLSATGEAALADIDHGAWTGSTFADIHARQPDLLAEWLADPASGTPGGETMASVQARVGAWLDATAPADAPLLAITHPMVVRAAIAHALAMPLAPTMAIDIAPLSRVRLSFNRQWRLQSLEPASAR